MLELLFVILIGNGITGAVAKSLAAFICTMAFTSVMALLIRLMERGFCSLEDAFTMNMRNRTLGPKYNDEPEAISIRQDGKSYSYCMELDKFTPRLDIIQHLYMWFNKGFPIYVSTVGLMLMFPTITIVISTFAFLELVMIWLYRTIKSIDVNWTIKKRRKSKNSVMDKQGTIKEHYRTNNTTLFVPEHIKLFDKE